MQQRSAALPLGPGGHCSKRPVEALPTRWPSPAVGFGGLVGIGLAHIGVFLLGPQEGLE